MFNLSGIGRGVCAAYIYGRVSFSLYLYQWLIKVIVSTYVTPGSPSTRAPPVAAAEDERAGGQERGEKSARVLGL